MDSFITGIHHVTSGVRTAQEDIDFFTQVVGQRMIKQTVLFDGSKPIYHLYYANKNAEIGTVMTTFPFKQVGYVGRRGSGQTESTCYTVPKHSLSFWQDHLKRHNAKPGPIAERFGQKVLSFEHPSGLLFEMVEDADDPTEPWTTDDIAADVAVKGFHSVVMAVRDIEEQEHFFVEGYGFRKVGTEGAYTRFHIRDGGAKKTIDLLHTPDRPQGSWHYGQGINHHVAFAVANDEENQKMKDHLEGLGYTDCSEIKDRNYFHSVYCRSPGGILCEMATTDIGFGIDEPLEHLGEKLLLPPWFEPRRAEIVSPLEPIDVPNYRPVGRVDPAT